jgi:hypothetical protein
MRRANDVLDPQLPDAGRRTRRPAPSVSPVGAALAVAGLAAVFVLARIALDVLLLLVLVAVVGVLRRTAGDWLGDVLGVRMGTVVFATAVGLAGYWIVATDAGRASVGQFFSEAGRLGFGNLVGNGNVIPPSTQPPVSSGSTGSASSPSMGTGGGGGGGTASSAPAATVPSAVDTSNQGSRVIPVRLTVRATNTTSDRVVLHATASAPGGTPEGHVEFRIDGRVVATARIGSDGSAETTVSVARSGSYRVQARFAGNSRFGPATGETAFTI